MSPFDSATPQVRSSNSSLQFFWSELQDPTIASVYFRFLSESRPLTEWSALDVYKTAAMLEKRAEGTWRGVVTAELKAVNDRQMMSETVSATAQLNDNRPQLTGTCERIIQWRNIEYEHLLRLQDGQIDGQPDGLTAGSNPSRPAGRTRLIHRSACCSFGSKLSGAEKSGIHIETEHRKYMQSRFYSVLRYWCIFWHLRLSAENVGSCINFGHLSSVYRRSSHCVTG